MAETLRSLGAILVLLVVAACAQTPVEAPRPGVPAPDPLPGEDTCDRAPYAAMIGQDGTTLERVMILRAVRVIRPGMAVTMDYIADRINFVIDDTGAIAQIYCG